MKNLSTATRATTCLVCLSVAIWLLASTLGIFPDEGRITRDNRARLCSALAANYAFLLAEAEPERMCTFLRALVEHHYDVVSAGLRQKDGALFADSGNHAKQWSSTEQSSSSLQMESLILHAEQPWGTLEVRFRDQQMRGWLGWFQQPLIRFLAFSAAMSYLLHYFFMQSMLERLDPSRLIPERIRNTLDTLAEGLIVVDKRERIVLANSAFAKFFGFQKGELTGRLASELPWQQKDCGDKKAEYPWVKAIREGSQQLGYVLRLSENESDQRVFKVNSSPILTANGNSRGAFVSFDDITLIENSRIELKQMLDSLTRSREEIRQQNHELKRLATLDPLTGCLNRRAFFRELERLWNTVLRDKYDMSAVMVDVDYFKDINDRKGHAGGDQVLQDFSNLLRTNFREDDLVCRYGGEEFCILLPSVDIELAVERAECCRKAIETTDFNGLRVTASLGVSSFGLGNKSAHDLLEQADKCLYFAKRTGRNRVERWDNIKDNPELEAPGLNDRISKVPLGDTGAAARSDLQFDEQSIPFHAVTALVSALGYRDPDTASHSRRVADLCVATADGKMSARDSYILETAALLHDIGKIGVPDSILLKPGMLTEDEWQIMHKNDRIGHEIVQSTFSNEQLAEIVTTYRAWFRGNPLRPELPQGSSICLGARILGIADAYDAMVSDRSYRPGRDREKAFEELRRCADNQFDPELVEHFIAMISSRDVVDGPSVAGVSKAVAITLGSQTERLANALEIQDLDGIAVLANRLRLTAAKHGLLEVVKLAATLEEAAVSETDDLTLVKLTSELLDICRCSQRAYLDQCQSPT